MERQHSARWKHWHSKRSCSTESHACAGQATTWFAQIETGTVSAARTRAFAMLIWWKLAKLRWHRARSYYIYLYIQSLLTTHVVWVTGSAQMGPERAADATDTTPSHHVTSCHIMSHQGAVAGAWNARLLSDAEATGSFRLETNCWTIWTLLRMADLKPWAILSSLCQTDWRPFHFHQLSGPG